MGRTNIFINGTFHSEIDSVLGLPEELRLSNLNEPNIVVIILQNGKIVRIPDNDYMKLYNVLLDFKNNNLWEHLDTILAFTEHSYTSCRNPHYIYPCMKIHPCAADFGKYLNTNSNPFKLLENVKEITDVDLMIETAIYYSTFDIGSIFTESNPIVLKIIAALKAERAKIGCLIDVHTMPDYFKYTPFVGNMWRCDNVTSLKEAEVGSPTVNTFEESMKNLHEFAINKLFNDPNVVIAGGSISKVLDTRYNKQMSRPSDLDMFIIGADNAEKLAAYKRIIAYFDSPDTYYAIHGSVTTVYITGVQRKYQIISHNINTVYELLSGFDLTYIQCCYYNGSFYATPMCCKSLKERCTQAGNLSRLRVNRIIKCLYYGFNVAITHELHAHCDIEDIIKDKSNMQLVKIVRDLHKFYYPMKDDSMDPEYARNHIMSMIESDSNGSIITDNSDYAVSNMLIGGSFDNNYESTLFTTFNINSLSKSMIPKHVRSTTLKTRHGSCIITSSPLSVISISESGGETPGVNITLMPDSPFEEFLTGMLEQKVYKLYRKGDVTKHIVNDGKIVTHIPSYRLTGQSQRGCILKTNHGSPLLIEEDLLPGDTVQIMFMVSLEMTNNSRSVELIILKIIKWTQEESKKIEPIKVVKDITEFTDTIQYED